MDFFMYLKFSKFGNIRFFARAAAAGCLALSGVAAYGQIYPTKVVRIVTGGTGSNGDFASRLLAPGLTQALGQQVIVENRPSGIILGEVVAKAPADGHTLLLTGSSFWLAPYMQDNVPWDPVRDFAPITLAASSPNLVVVHPSVPAQNFKALIDLLKAKPGALNFASPGTGSTPHLASELLKQMAGVNFVHVPYKGDTPALTDLLAGQMHMQIASGPVYVPHIKAGKVRAVAVTYDSGNYPACLDGALKKSDYANFPARQAVARKDGRYIGIGMAIAVEATGLGPYESATVRVATSGRITIYTGASPQGQAHKTTLAQIASDQLGVSFSEIDVVTSDTAATALGMGTFAARTAVNAGNSVHVAAMAVADKAKKIAAGMMECLEDDLELADGCVRIRVRRARHRQPAEHDGEDQYQHRPQRETDVLPFAPTDRHPGIRRHKVEGLHVRNHRHPMLLVQEFPRFIGRRQPSDRRSDDHHSCHGILPSQKPSALNTCGHIHPPRYESSRVKWIQPLLAVLPSRDASTIRLC